MEMEAERKKAEQRRKIEYQVACEERAHRIVERLIDNPVTQEQLINAVPKQKYVISTKTNKVYDIESRKNFCSPRCYKASKHLECQISSDPVWSRKNMRPTQFDILALDLKTGKLGDEVIVSKAGVIRDDLSRLEKLDKYQKNLAERIHEHNVDMEEEERARRSKSEKNENEESEVGENATEDGAVVYTLDKTMNELSLERNDRDEKDGKQNDTEQLNDDMKSINDSESCIEKASGDKVNADSRETVDAQENNIHSAVKSTGSKTSKRNKEAGPSKSKTDYLMQLLDKRKSLLAKMADIQNDNPKDEGKQKQEYEDRRVRETVADKARRDDNVARKKENITLVPEGTKTELPDLSAKQGESGEIKTSEKSYCKTVAEKKKEKDSIKNSVKDEQKRTGGVSALDLICKGVQSWITLKSVEHLKVAEQDEKKLECSTVNKAFEKQYQDLVAKVDAQEKDFDALLGEETMTSDHTDRPSAPLPHFDVLREELEADQIRVQEFMKGSFTYKVKEKQSGDKDLEGSSIVVLPTVDRYDQLLIRQRIVIDRISKVLPDVLSPLHLLIQDVFTELRELICTFNLTSDNITFKPAEWTIVTVILLRMLSRRMITVQRSFTSPGAEKYFTLLLSSIGAGIDSVDGIVNNLLKIEKPRKVRMISVE
ncbi:putative RNA polymerase II subunit B1 CTD phosphatase RPAP2 isoform X2 [Mercenaria mercenaria]|uniref:putative RNA polymerase II subunit B1 CTD phosphatase RPAP2 isoform X2 n=1 Tax=Mercenaria mercenaria TaxID=6596 RepID=UPI00234FA2BB|nr:putative RNA polymerase II subunit B1 CTD phosphatase RPAP2 isoform X2 [Mercenaria mercenaria]